MEEIRFSRRECLGAAAAAVGVGLASKSTAAERPAREPFGYCLNTSTISGQKRTLPEEIDLAAKAGYQGFEPWIRELDQYVKSGGSLKDLGKRLSDKGLKVESSIGFCEWIVEDD